MPPTATIKVSLKCPTRTEWNFKERPAHKRMTWTEVLENNGVHVNPEAYQLAYSDPRYQLAFDQSIEDFLKQFKRRKSAVTVRLVQVRFGSVQRGRGRPPLNKMNLVEHRPLLQNGNGGLKRPQTVQMIQHNNAKAPRLDIRNFARPLQREEEDDEDEDDEDENNSIQVPYRDQIREPSVPPPPLHAPPSPRRPAGPMPFNFARPNGVAPPRVPYQAPHRVAEPPGGGPRGNAYGHNFMNDDNASQFSAATQDSQDNVEGGMDRQAVIANKLVRGITSRELDKIADELQALFGTERGMKVARYMPITMNMLNNVFAS